MDVFALQLGVQWAWATLPNTVFSPSAHAQNAGGNQHIPFPDARRIWTIAWQSSVKVANHEVLFHFVASPIGNQLGEAGQITLLSTHHIGGPPQTIIRTVELPESGIVVPAGYVA